MKTLIIFALAVLISFSTQDPYIDSYTSFVCPDKKAKIGEDVCAIKSSKDGTKINPNIVYIKKKSCGKNKGCSEYTTEKYNIDTDSSIKYYGGDTDDTIYTCQKKIKLLKIGKKCVYNAECFTGYCKSGKCAAYTENENCKGIDVLCGPGKYCKNAGSYTDSGDPIYACTAYAKENEDCSKTSCGPGLGCYSPSATSTTYTCKKFFTIDTGKYTTDRRLCKSYFESNYLCIEIASVADDCKITYNKGEENVEETITYNLFKSVNNKNYCYQKPEIKQVVSDLAKRYGKIKLNKLLDKENCDYSDYLCDKKYAELMSVYSDYGKLLYYGLIKENGEKNKDKKCEYEFWRTVSISSSYIKVCLGFSFALLCLLF